MSAAVTGSGSLILVTGEAGIGKTTLVESALRRAAPDLVTAWGTCREGPGVPGFWPWAEVIRACAEKGLVDGGTTAEQVALGLAGKPQLELGAAESADAASGRFALFDAVAHTLRRVAAKQTLAVVLDDLQWADLGTLRLLRFLAPDVGRARLLVIGAYRDEELAWGDEQSRQVIDGVASKVTTLALPSLDPAEVAQLVADLDGSAPGADVARDIWRRTGGNPFLVQQVARLGSRTTEIPAGARDAVSRRLAHLSEACVDLLKVAAVVGAQFDSAVLVGAAASSAGVQSRSVR